MIPRRVSPWEFHLFIQNHSQVLLYNVKKTKGIFTPVGIWKNGTPGMSNLDSISYLNYIISKDIKLKHLLCYSLHFLLISLIQSWNILYTCTDKGVHIYTYLMMIFDIFFFFFIQKAQAIIQYSSSSYEAIHTDIYGIHPARTLQMLLITSLI